MKSGFCFICSVIFLFSCNIGGVDKELSGHSIYWNDGIGQRYIYSVNATLYRTTIYGDVIDYDYDNKFIVVKQSPNRDHYINHLGFDLYGYYTTYRKYIEDTNILSKPEWKDFRGKIERDSLIYNIFNSKGATAENTSKDIIIRNRIADSLVSNDPYYQKIFANDTNYWIIYNPIDSLIGPLTKSEFEATRKGLGIPDDLKFD